MKVSIDARGCVRRASGFVLTPKSLATGKQIIHNISQFKGV
jgi:hypothetical protein